MRGERYDIAYRGMRHCVSAIWVPEKRILFQFVSVRRIDIVRPLSFPPPDADKVTLRGEMRVLGSVIKAALKFLQEQERFDARQRVLNMAEDLLSNEKERSRGRLQKHAGKLFAS